MRVRRVPAEVLETDLSQINSLDDFSKYLAFFWEWDSMADVDAIVVLEKEFGVSFSDEEAESMKTMKDIDIAVHQKLRLSDQR